MTNGSNGTNSTRSNDDDDDPVVSSTPLFLSTRLVPYLHSVHSPPAINPEDGCAACKCKLKAKHGWLWLETPVDSHHLTMDRQRAGEFSRAAAGNAVAGLSVDMSTTRAHVGDIESGVMDRFVLVMRSGSNGAFLSPISGHVDLRPSLLGVDLMTADKAHAGQSGVGKKSEGELSSAEQKIMPTFQKRETEEQQQARLSSYDHLHRVWEEEPWTGATFYPAQLEETIGIAGRLVADTLLSSDDADCLPTHSTVSFMRNMGLIRPDDDEEYTSSSASGV